MFHFNFNSSCFQQ